MFISRAFQLIKGRNCFDEYAIAFKERKFLSIVTHLFPCSVRRLTLFTIQEKDWSSIFRTWWCRLHVMRPVALTPNPAIDTKSASTQLEYVLVLITMADTFTSRYTNSWSSSENCKLKWFAWFPMWRMSRFTVLFHMKDSIDCRFNGLENTEFRRFSEELI